MCIPAHYQTRSCQAPSTQSSYELEGWGDPEDDAISEIVRRTTSGTYRRVGKCRTIGPYVNVNLYRGCEGSVLDPYCCNAKCPCFKKEQNS